MLSNLSRGLSLVFVAGFTVVGMLNPSTADIGYLYAAFGAAFGLGFLLGLVPRHRISWPRKLTLVLLASLFWLPVNMFNIIGD